MMKKILMTVFTAAAIFFVGGTDTEASSTTHTVVSGDTLYKLGQQYGVSALIFKERTINLLL